MRQRRLPAALLEIAESDSICFPLVERAAMGASRVHFDVRQKMKRKVTILELPDDAKSFSAPFEEDYALLLVIASPQVSGQQRNHITSDIVTSRCQYALTFGHDCEVWHDAIDESCFDDGMELERFLMTTWHEDEPIEDVIDFLWWNIFYEDFESERLAVVLIGGDDELVRAIRKRLANHQKQEADKARHPIPDRAVFSDRFYDFNP